MLQICLASCKTYFQISITGFLCKTYFQLPLTTLEAKISLQGNTQKLKQLEKPLPGSRIPGGRLARLRSSDGRLLARAAAGCGASYSG